MNNYTAEFGGNVRFLNPENTALYDADGKVVKCKCGEKATTAIMGKEAFLARCDKCMYGKEGANE